VRQVAAEYRVNPLTVPKGYQQLVDEQRSPKAMPCIEARGLRKAFGTTLALDGVDLRVEEGRILGLIGPNGAGKTTALNAILGLTRFDRAKAEGFLARTAIKRSSKVRELSKGMVRQLHLALVMAIDASARSSVAASCSSITWIGTSSPPSGTCARPASPSCSWP
jgi:ABC-type uncharacterized transport system ATPase subunit